MRASIGVAIAGLVWFTTCAPAKPIDLACGWEVKQAHLGGVQFQPYLLDAGKMFSPDRPAMLTIDVKAETVLVQHLTEVGLGKPRLPTFHDDLVSIPFPRTNIRGIRDREHEVIISINRYDLSSDFTLVVRREPEGGMFAEFSRRGACNIKKF